jgi:hypothetical protein
MTTTARPALRFSCFCILGFAWLFSPKALEAADSSGWCTVPRSAISPEAVAQAVRAAQTKFNDPPQAMPSIVTEHTMPHQGNRDQIDAAKKDLPTMLDAAIAWYGGAGNQYFEMANRYLVAWIGTYRPDYNPVDEADFDQLIGTYAIIREKMDPGAQAKVASALRDWATGYISEMAQHPEAREGHTDVWNNNWQSHRVKLVTMISVALRDQGMFEQAKQLFWMHLQVNMKPDGSVIDFYQRDAIYYVGYDLLPLLEAALAARSMGEDWYHSAAPNGASLEKGVKWLAPYASGEKTHEEFVNSKVPFDAQRRVAGVEGMSGLYDPTKASKVMWLASQFDPQFRSIAASLGRKEPPFLAVCGH